MVGLGAGIAVALIILDEFLRLRGASFRAHVMPVAVGIYLPFSLAVPILAGGIVAWQMERAAGRRGPTFLAAAKNIAILISSGLIAGEAIAGILIAVPRTLGWELPIPVIDSDLLTIAAMLAVAGWIYQAGRSVKVT
jgi:putative OPT family oligopeptide transporter